MAGFSAIPSQAETGFEEPFTLDCWDKKGIQNNEGIEAHRETERARVGEIEIEREADSRAECVAVGIHPRNCKVMIGQWSVDRTVPLNGSWFLPPIGLHDSE